MRYATVTVTRAVSAVARNATRTWDRLDDVQEDWSLDTYSRAGYVGIKLFKVVGFIFQVEVTSGCR